jgi:DNA-binding NarL/FixJ family response regulator
MAQLKRILLVDDDEDLREALGEQLVMTEDFDVFEAGNGAEAPRKGFTIWSSSTWACPTPTGASCAA